MWERTARVRRVMWAFLFLATALPAWSAEKRALLIGINDYLANDAAAPAADGDTWVPEDLNGALNDIELMQGVLKSRYGFEAANITTLVNAEATRHKLLQALDEFVASTGPEDIVYIHFSGHGSQVEDLDGDEADGMDETILPHDARTGGVPDITDDELGRVLAGLRSPNSLVVLDSCHSGTATRGSSLLKVRAVPADKRSGLYESPAGAAPGAQGAHVLMTGAADYQSALDGPIDDGRFYGLFTLSLGRAMARMPAGSSARALHREARREMERIGEQFGLFAVPDAQLEAPDPRLDDGILGESAIALARRNAVRLAWAAVQPEPGGNVRLVGAGDLAARPGAAWAIYPPGETRFLPGAAGAIAVIRRLDQDDAIAAVEGSAAPAVGSRAVPLAPAPPAPGVPLRLEGVSDDDRQALAAALRRTPGGQDIELVPVGTFARFLVDREGDRLIVYGAGGLQKVREIPAQDLQQAARDLVALGRRSRQVNELLALDNPTSEIRLDVHVNPVDSGGNNRGVAVVGAADVSAYRVRQPGQPRDRSNSLVLEIEVSQDSYLTVVDVDPEGAVNVLFPNPVSERNGFLPGGYVRTGSPVRIPDGLNNNRAGFYWDYVPPTGLDTLRIFAASNPETARRIRAFLAGFSTPMQQRGGDNAGTGRLDLYRAGAGMGTRGVAVVEAADETPPDWAAASVTVWIEE